MMDKKLLSEWNYNKNGDLKPEDFSDGSHKKIWWICKDGHEWQAQISHRVLRGNGCPYCSGRYPIKGENDSETLYPKLLEEWDIEANAESSLADFLPKSNKKVYWKCEEGHKWKARICDRTRGRNCPYCAGKKPIKGKTDFESCFPELVYEWNYNKNIGVNPADFTAHSHKKVWWACKKCGSDWLASIKDRSYGASCPYCDGRMVISGVNDLLSKMPEIAEEFHPTKNMTIQVEEITVQSNQKIWWRCKYGHEWKIEVYARANGNNCPYCAGKRAISGVNDLTTVNPLVIQEWDYEKNGKLTPDQVLPKSNRKVWWRCINEHSWKASIYHRSMGTGCPYCAKGEMN